MTTNMTTTTMEGNRIIAEFMGHETGYDSGDKTKPMVVLDGSPVNIGDWAQYHTSWDWLMPVVEKIYKLSNNWPKLTESVWQIRIVAPIETVYQNVVDVIISYNTSNRPDGE